MCRILATAIAIALIFGCSAAVDCDCCGDWRDGGVMPQNIVPSEAEAPTVVAPSSGDPVTDGSIVQGEQPLTDWLQWLYNRLTGAATMPVAKADTEAGAQLAEVSRTLGAAGTSDYWIIDDSQLGSGSNGKTRLYGFASGGQVGMVYTVNAAWDPATSLWTRDAVAPSSRVQLAPGLAITVLDSTENATPFSDDDFIAGGLAGLILDDEANAGALQLRGSKGAATPVANTFYSDSMPKAWGKISSDGAGGLTLDSGFNVGSVTISGGDVVVELLTNMADSDYVVTAASLTVPIPGRFASVYNMAPGGFSLRAYDADDGTISSFTTVAQSFCFTVFGRQ